MVAKSIPAPVSVLILTFNEEKNIERCLEHVSWANEIVVVDAYSSDATRRLCEKAGCSWSSKMNFQTRSWTGFRDQRNFSLECAKNDWVLVVDADEVCTPALRDRIVQLMSLQSQPPFRAYKVHRQEYFLGKKIFHGMWNPSYQDRFFNKIGVKYINDVHEYPVFAETPGVIHESLEHFSDLDISKYLQKIDKYTTIEAKDRFEQGQRAGLFKLVGAFPAHFLKTLFYYGGYKDGIHGVAIALIEGISRLVRQLKIWQLEIKK